MRKLALFATSLLMACTLSPAGAGPASASPAVPGGGGAVTAPGGGTGVAAPADTAPRTTKSCSNPVGLPLSETFTPSTTVTMYSLPFHAAAGRTITIDVAAELDDPSANPSLGTIGVEVHQCCAVRDSEIMPQVVGPIGPAGRPAHTRRTVTLSDRCTIPTRFGEEFVYYLRLRISDSADAVRLSYSVS
ncbi:hypothetical protein [Streptomyces sp. URMC 123]|uniref:hypothetical protein n=1 Tax=Streptomyces sp. URMC 123 TaxID=3423403 RepID=UPI003F1D9E0C